MSEQPTQSWIYFELPPDKELQAAFGRVSLRHAHLDYALRMTIKTLANVTITEALDGTVWEGSGALRKRISALARRELGDGAALIKIDAWLERCRRATDHRNDFVHSIWAREMDGEHMLRGHDHKWRALPSVAELGALEIEINELVFEINEARIRGWLAKALAKKRTKTPG